MSTTYVNIGIVSDFSLNGRLAGYYSFVWKTIVWSGDSQGMSGNVMLKILSEPWLWICVGVPVCVCMCACVRVCVGVGVCTHTHISAAPHPHPLAPLFKWWTHSKWATSVYMHNNNALYDKRKKHTLNVYYKPYMWYIIIQICFTVSTHSKGSPVLTNSAGKDYS